MNKLYSILFVILGVFLFSSVLMPTVKAVYGKPGTSYRLIMDNYTMETTGKIVTPSWTPAYVKWYLYDPYGKIVYMVESPLDSVEKTGSGFNSATWRINEDSGLITIPAFATDGMWTIQAKIYDMNHLLIIQWSNQAQFTLYTIHVEGGNSLDSLNAPLEWYFNFGSNMLMGDMEYGIATPNVIWLILIVIVIIVLVINVRAFRRRKKVNA